MKTNLIISKSLPLCAAFLAAATLFSGTARAGAPDGAGYRPKNRSIFTGTLVARDPFWPIGWTRGSAKSETAVAEPEIRAEDFTVTAILLASPALAVINGREYGEGQFIPISGGAVKAQIAAILDGRVLIRYKSKTVSSPLVRNEHMSSPRAYVPSLEPGEVSAQTPTPR